MTIGLLVNKDTGSKSLSTSYWTGYTALAPTWLNQFPRVSGPSFGVALSRRLRKSKNEPALASAVGGAETSRLGRLVP
jgi:hypothetical protein